VRVGAPMAFLLAATVAVLLVRQGLSEGTSPSTPTVRVTTTPSTSSTIGTVPRYYTIRPGDTLSLVAIRFETTVDRLVELNPGIDATNLTPGRRLRIE
jgi:peptidoglycan endopeptidase LytE